MKIGVERSNLCAASGDVVADVPYGRKSPIVKLVRPAKMDPGMALRARNDVRESMSASEGWQQPWRWVRRTKRRRSKPVGLQRRCLLCESCIHGCVKKA